MIRRDLVCIVCPNGCALHVEEEAEGHLVVTGQRCPKGKNFALEECTEPMRSLSSTVKTIFPEVPVLPVRVSREVPKRALFDVMREINQVVLTERLGQGEAVIHDVCHLGVDVIITSNRLKGVHQHEAV